MTLSRSLAPMDFGLLFLVAVLAFTTATTTDTPLSFYVIATGVIGGYMALNIGANDVVNNMGPLAAIVAVAGTSGVSARHG